MFRQTLIYQHKDTNGVFNDKVSSNKRPASPKCILQHVAGLTRWFLCFPRPTDFGNDEKCPCPTGWFTAQPVELGRVDALVGDAVAARNMLGALGGSEITPNVLEKLVDFVFTVVDLAQMPQISQNSSKFYEMVVPLTMLTVPNFIQFPIPSAAFCSGPPTFGGFLRVSHWGVLHG